MPKSTPFFYKSNVINWVKLIAINVAIILVFVDITLERYSYFAKDGIKSLDGILGFYAIIGAFGSIILIGVSLLIAKFLQVDEDYYADDF